MNIVQGFGYNCRYYVEGRNLMNRLFKLLVSKGIKHKNKGFTLVELITVIGIIGILSVAIIPTVTGAKEKAMKAKYMSDCKTIVTAVEIYNAMSSTDSIGDSTTIEQVKTKLLSAEAEDYRYLKAWPKKLPEELGGTGKTYKNIVEYVNGPDDNE